MSASTKIIAGFLAMCFPIMGVGCSNPQISKSEEFEESSYEENQTETESLRQEFMTNFGEKREDSLIKEYSRIYDTNARILDSSEVSHSILENRDGEVIIERRFGEVIDSDTGDGRVINAYDKDYDYIGYGSDKEFQDGTLIMTYLVYNPETSYIDDIVERYDYVVGQEL